MPRIASLLAVAILALPVVAAPPAAIDPRLTIELIAGEPDLVTPTGVVVDPHGRIFVIENHTHQRPANYQGPVHDRIKLFEDFDPTGKARKSTVWAEGFRDSMGLALGGKGELFLATRAAIFRLRDVGGKGVADDKETLVKLETTANYPHNGLAGFGADALGDLYFGLGENFGAPYRLVGRDGKVLTGGGEGGSVYRVKSDGSGLTRVATGFWNPFHMTFDRWGRLFVVDNDPDARGPCRLLHIVQGGDYGYRFRYGRKGIHPFQSWNGELPGTLPMVAGTAEAPSGIVATETDALPDDFRGQLWSTSWGDHIIEQFTLEPRGASFGAVRKIVVRGGEDFRPVGIVLAPDGSLVVSDWVDKSYPVHGKGRLWRIRSKEAPKSTGPDLPTIARLANDKLVALLDHSMARVRFDAARVLAARGEEGRTALADAVARHPSPLGRLHALWMVGQMPPAVRNRLIAVGLKDASPHVRAEAVSLIDRLMPPEEHGQFTALAELAAADPAPLVRTQALRLVSGAKAIDLLLTRLTDDDPFVVAAALEGLKRQRDALPPILAERASQAKTARLRLAVLLAARLCDRPLVELCEQFLLDPDPALRRAAIQWVGEERLMQLAKQIDASAALPPVSREVFEAWLATRELLANPGPLKNPSQEPSGDVLVLAVLRDAKQPAALRALALRMLPAQHAQLKLPELLALAASPDKALRAEAIKALAWRSDDAAQDLLRKLAADDKESLVLRADAVLGLAHSAATSEATRKLLFDLQPTLLDRDAVRSLRGATGPRDAAAVKAWWKEAGTLNLPNPRHPDENYEQGWLAFGEARKEMTPRPATVEAWREMLLKGEWKQHKGDPAAGERVFFHPKGPRCFACHKVDGRGEAVGPDLSRIGAALDKNRLIESILEPSKEVAPAFVTWLFTMTDGKQHTGVITDIGAHSTITLADATGKRTTLKITEIESRVAQKTSIMPADLHNGMTRLEFLDLLAYLEGRK